MVKISDRELVLNVDWAVQGTLGFGLGGSIFGGVQIGWGSTNIDDSISGESFVGGGSAAYKLAGNITISVPKKEDGMHIDPYYGIVPFTVYIAPGIGGGYASFNYGHGETFRYLGGELRRYLTPYLPENWRK